MILRLVTELTSGELILDGDSKSFLFNSYCFLVYARTVPEVRNCQPFGAFSSLRFFSTFDLARQLCPSRPRRALKRMREAVGLAREMLLRHHAAFSQDPVPCRLFRFLPGDCSLRQGNFESVLGHNDAGACLRTGFPRL